MNKNILLIIVVGFTLSVGGVFWLLKPAPKSTAYELYWGEGCQHCKNVEEFLTTWEGKDKVKIEKLEAQEDKANSVKMLKRAKACGLDTAKGLGVPFLYTPDGKCLSGDTPIIDYFKGTTF